MKVVISIAMIMLGLGPVACAGTDGIRTVRGDWTGYSLKYLQYAASKGMLPTIVSGNGFAGVSDAAVEQVVLTELSGRPMGVGPIAFEPYLAGSETPPLFVSWVFNPAPSFDSRNACDPGRAAQAGGQARADGTTRVVAAFCSSQRLLSGSVGYAEGLAGPEDSRFKSLIRLLAIDLFPPWDPDQGGGCGNCP